MAITFIGASTATASSNIMTPTEPTGTAQNDLVIAVTTVAAANRTITLPADCTPIDQVQGANPPNLTTQVCYKIRGADEGDGYSFSFDSSVNFGRTTLLTFRGVDTSTPFDVAYVKASHYVEKPSDSGAAGPAKPITTVTDGAWVVLFLTEASDGSFTAGAPSGYTLRADDQQSNRVIVVASKEVATAGTETPGNWTHTSMGAVDSINYTLALRPLVAAAGKLRIMMAHNE